MEMCWCDNTLQGIDLGQTHFNPVVGEPYCTPLPPEENQQHGPVEQLSLPEGNAPPWHPSGPWPGYYNNLLPVPVGSEPATEAGGQQCSFGGYGYGASSAAAGLQTGMVGEAMRYEINYIRPARESESVRPVQARHQTPDIRRDLTVILLEREKLRQERGVYLPRTQHLAKKLVDFQRQLRDQHLQSTTLNQEDLQQLVERIETHLTFWKQADDSAIGQLLRLQQEAVLLGHPPPDLPWDSDADILLPDQQEEMIVLPDKGGERQHQWRPIGGAEPSPSLERTGVPEVISSRLSPTPEQTDTPKVIRSGLSLTPEQTDIPEVIRSEPSSSPELVKGIILRVPLKEDKVGSLKTIVDGMEKRLSFSADDVVTKATMLVGDKVQFKIATNPKTKAERAVKVEILTDTFDFTDTEEKRRSGVVLGLSYSFGYIKSSQDLELPFELCEVMEEEQLSVSEKVEYSTVPNVAAGTGYQAVRIRRSTANLSEASTMKQTEQKIMTTDPVNPKERMPKDTNINADTPKIVKANEDLLNSISGKNTTSKDNAGDFPHPTKSTEESRGRKSKNSDLGSQNLNTSDCRSRSRNRKHLQNTHSRSRACSQKNRSRSRERSQKNRSRSRERSLKNRNSTRGRSWDRRGWSDRLWSHWSSSREKRQGGWKERSDRDRRSRSRSGGNCSRPKHPRERNCSPEDRVKEMISDGKKVGDPENPSNRSPGPGHREEEGRRRTSSWEWKHGSGRTDTVSSAVYKDLSSVEASETTTSSPLKPDVGDDEVLARKKRELEEVYALIAEKKAILAMDIQTTTDEPIYEQRMESVLNKDKEDSVEHLPAQGPCSPQQPKPTAPLTEAHRDTPHDPSHRDKPCHPSQADQEQGTLLKDAVLECWAEDFLHHARTLSDTSHIKSTEHSLRQAEVEREEFYLYGDEADGCYEHQLEPGREWQPPGLSQHDHLATNVMKRLDEDSPFGKMKTYLKCFGINLKSWETEDSPVTDGSNERGLLNSTNSSAALSNLPHHSQNILVKTGFPDKENTASTLEVLTQDRGKRAVDYEKILQERDKLRKQRGVYLQKREHLAIQWGKYQQQLFCQSSSGELTWLDHEDPQLQVMTQLLGHVNTQLSSLQSADDLAKAHLLWLQQEAVLLGHPPPDHPWDSDADILLPDQQEDGRQQQQVSKKKHLIIAG